MCAEMTRCPIEIKIELEIDIAIKMQIKTEIEIGPPYRHQGTVYRSILDI